MLEIRSPLDGFRSPFGLLRTGAAGFTPFTVLDSDGNSFTAPLGVLNSSGTSFTVTNAVLDSDGNSFTV